MGKETLANQPKEVRTLELGMEKKALLFERLDGEEFLEAVKKLPWQLYDREIMGVFNVLRYLEETGDPFQDDKVQELIDQTEKKIQIPLSGIIYEFPLLETMFPEPDLRFPPILDKESLEELVPEKIRQALILRYIGTQIQLGKNAAFSSGAVEETQVKVLAEYFQLTAMNYLREINLPTRAIATVLYRPRSARELRNANYKVKRWLRGQKLPSSITRACNPSVPETYLKILTDAHIFETQPGVESHRDQITKEWLNRTRAFRPLKFYTRGTKQNPSPLKEIIRSNQQKEDILPIILLMAVGKWSCVQARLEMYQGGKITVKCPVQRRKNINNYKTIIFECHQFAQEMKQEVFEGFCGLNSASEAIAFFNSVAGITIDFCGEREKLRDLKGLLKYAQELLTEEQWEKL